MKFRTQAIENSVGWSDSMLRIPGRAAQFFRAVSLHFPGRRRLLLHLVIVLRVIASHHQKECSNLSGRIDDVLEPAHKYKVT